MKLWEIFRYDFASQSRRLTTAIFGAGLAWLTLLIGSTFLDDARRDGVLLNAPMVTAATIVLATLVSVLSTAAVAGEAATRDVSARIDPLLYTAPLPKPAYLGGRFLSAFAIVAALLVVAPLILAAGRFLPGVEKAFFGPFRLVSYLEPYLLIALPNAFITTALLFSLALWSRRAMVSYAGAAVLFANTIVQDEVVAAAMGKWELAKLLDPFGMVITKALWRSWTVPQRNALSLELDGVLLANRLLWIGIALATLTIVVARFRMAHEGGGGRRRAKWFTAHPVAGRRTRGALASAAEAQALRHALPRVRGTFGGATRVRQAIAIALHSYREMITTRAALIIPAMGLLLFKITPELLEVGLGTPARPTTGRITMLYGAFATIGIVVGAMIVFFAGWLVWRERDAREHDIAGVAPVPDAVTLLGKFGGLTLLILTMQAAMIGAGIATQIAYGHSDLEIGLYLRVLFGLKLVDYLLFAALAIAIHVVIDQKYLAMSLAMLAWLHPQYVPDLGIQHHLLLYASDPGVRYSEMSGFGASLGPWLWFKLYWLGWALLFALVARLFWVRGRDDSFRQRVALARRRLTRAPRALAFAALALIAFAGGFVFYNTNVLNEYVTGKSFAERSAEYERRYGRHAALPQPVVAATKLRIELHPHERRADVRGTYRLENRTGQAIDAIHLVTQRNASTSNVTFDRPARAEVLDEEVGYRIYALGRPLAPGDSLQVAFDVRIEHRGFTNDGVSPSLTANGTFLEHRPDNGRSWLPSVGYRRALEVDGAYDRKKHGLPPRPALRPLEDVAARSEEIGLEHVDVETIIGTEAGQIAVAPGALRRTWSENGRRYFHYATDAPIRNSFPILSARYTVHRSRWNGVDVEVLHHPEHAWNAERFARAARASLDVYSRAFGPYPQGQLRLVEFPSTGGTRMTGYPGTVVWSEVFALAEPEKDWRKIDFPSGVIAHEVAHQWWGNQIVPARVEGAPLLTESPAWYSAMLVVEEMFGRKHLDRFMEVMRESYLVPHETPEVPLLRATDWLATYRTGALAMHSLREAIGEAAVNGALRRLVEKHHSGGPPFPTSLDLYRELQTATPAASRPLLKDLFAEVTFWDLQMKSVKSEPAAGGAYRVTLDVQAHKVKAGPGGREWHVPMDEEIDVAVLDARKAPLHLQKHRIRSGRQTITVVVPRAPSSAAIDGKHKLLDRKREDNFQSVQ